MQLLILLFAISRLSECILGIPYHGVTVGITPYSVPVNSHSQYHAQDIHGHYAYGYATGLSAQDEVKTSDGVTRGGYSYIDANGILQTVQYVSDSVHGFRVAATNLPQDLPEVAAARAQHLAHFEYIKAEHAAIAANRAQLPAAISPVSAPGTIIVPVRAIAPNTGLQSVPVAYIPSSVAVSSQYHAQDGHGQYTYGYASPLSAKSETKTTDGVTRGGYSYIDANGILQTVQYISDPVNGFRVTATNLPQAPSVTLIGPKVTTSVVGPKDNNAASVAVAPSTDAVIAPVVSAVSTSAPVPVESHIDSIAIEQRPVLVQADIVRNANIPLASSVQTGPYIRPNSNHAPFTVYTNSKLEPPLHPPIPITHSQAVLHQQTPLFSAPPTFNNNPYVIESPGDARYSSQNVPHTTATHGTLITPSQFLTAPYASYPGNNNIPTSFDINEERQINPTVPILQSDSSSTQIIPDVSSPYYSNTGSIPISAQNNYFVPNLATPNANSEGPVPADAQQEINPNVLNPNEYQGNYQVIPFSHQQVLSQREDTSLFTPDVGVQQVQQYDTPINSGDSEGRAQIPVAPKQPFVVRVAEADTASNANEETIITAKDESPGTSAGYYTQYIEY